MTFDTEELVVDMEADELVLLKQSLLDSGYSNAVVARIIQWYLTAP